MDDGTMDKNSYTYSYIHDTAQLLSCLSELPTQ